MRRVITRYYDESLRYHSQRECLPVSLNGSKIPQAEDVKYLGLRFDRRLNGTKHISIKRKQLGIQPNNILAVWPQIAIVDRK